MKKILFRKLLLDCLVFFVMTLLSISLIIWVFQAVNFLDIMIEDGRNYNVYLSYTILNLPKIISRILPFALFFSFTYVFIKYEIHNELIIFWNYGVNKFHLINFFFRFSILAMIIQIIMLSIIVPKSQEFARSLFKTSDVDYFEGLIKPKKFNDTIKGLTIYAEEKKDDGELKNIYIKKTSDPVKFQITFSKKGIFETRGNSKILVLYDGQTLSNNNGKLSNFNFSKSDFGLADMSSHTVLQTKIQEQSSNDIIKCLQILLNEKKSKIINCNLQNIRNIYKETFKRFVTPLYIPLLILTSLLLLLSSKESIKYSKYKILVYTVGFITIVLSEASLGYLNENILVNLGLMILPIFLTIVLYSIFIVKLKFKKKLIKA